MNALFSYHYDYYEWEELVCASESENLLIDYYNRHCSRCGPLVEGEKEHDKLANEERSHYLIGAILYIQGDRE